MKIRRLLCILAAIVLLSATVLCAHADFGDYGGDSDYGGSYDSGDSYDSYDYGSDYDYDDSDDYDSGNYYYAGGLGDYSDDDDGSSGGSGWLGTLVFAAIVVAVIIVAAKKKNGGSSARKVVAPGAAPTDSSTLKPLSEYLALDPSFDESAFKEKLSNMYVRFQNSWQAKDLEDLRPYLTDAFYSQVDRQLDNYRSNHQTNRIERIAVLGVDIAGWKQEGGNDVMVARLRTRIVDYVVDDSTGAVVRGSQTAEKFMEYEWDVVRTSGKTTKGSSGTTVQVCPNCGAHVDINHSAKCEYCGSILTTDSFDWAVSTIKGLSQRTAS